MATPNINYELQKIFSYLLAFQLSNFEFVEMMKTFFYLKFVAHFAAPLSVLPLADTPTPPFPLPRPYQWARIVLSIYISILCGGESLVSPSDRFTPQRRSSWGSLYSSIAESWCHQQLLLARNRTRVLPSITSDFTELPELYICLVSGTLIKFLGSPYFSFPLIVLVFSHSVSFYSIHFYYLSNNLPFVVCLFIGRLC